MAGSQVDIRAVFCEALDRKTPQARAAFLDQACRGEPETRAQLEALLRDHEEAGGTPQEDFTPTVRAPADQVIRERPGTFIGPYELQEQIGAGGFGVVFLAEQVHPARKVAIKVLKSGVDANQIIARFEAERQALALMDHPNIARVLDGGATFTGRSYFVMELVRGFPITAYCDENRLTPRQRLELFVDVCQAVQHAHQKGIIHRDIKPSNVLITLHDGKPTVKVIDFGIARATGRQFTDKKLFTGFAKMIGTLYISPEQAIVGNVDIDTRSDIYSLGVILYELLAGSTPIEKGRLRELGLDELLRIIREDRPPSPSTRLSTLRLSTSNLVDATPLGPTEPNGFAEPGLETIAAQRRMEPVKLARLARGDLDCIVMKALEKDRDRRYGMAANLAEDIERYLRNQAILARPPAATYKLGKFIQRNRGTVLATAAMAGALLLGTLVASRQKAQARRGQADALAAAAAAKKAQETAEEREAQALAMLDFMENKVLAALRPDGPGGGPGRDVTLRQAIAAALPALDKSFVNQPVVEAKVRATLGQSFLHLGEAAGAADQLSKARLLFAKHLGADHPRTLQTMNDLAGAYADVGRNADAQKLHEETLALQTAKLGPGHADTLTSVHAVAAGYSQLGRYADAIKLNEQALAMERARFGPYHPHTLSTMNNLAQDYYNAGRYADALKLHEETLALLKSNLGNDHPATLRSMGNLALAYAAVGRHADALGLREQALAASKAKLGPDDPDTLLSMHNLAASYCELGRHGEALELYEQTLAKQKAKLGPGHPDTLLSMRGVALSLVALGRGAEAVPIVDACVELAVGKNVHPRLIPFMVNLRLRHFEKAKEVAACRATAELWEKLKRTDPASLYDAACFRAVTAAILRANDSSPGARAQADAEADRAMAWLQQAVAGGFTNVDHLKKDTDLDILRDREDYQKLVTKLAAAK